MNAIDSNELRWIREAIEERNKIEEEKNNTLNCILTELRHIKGNMQ